MSIHDRDWYREEIKAKAQGERSSAPGKRFGTAVTGSSRKFFGWSASGVLAVLLFAVVIAIARDMKDRGVPFSWQGIRWWLSLWF